MAQSGFAAVESGDIPPAVAASHGSKVVAITDGDTIKVTPAGQPGRNYHYNANQKLADGIPGRVTAGA